MSRKRFLSVSNFDALQHYKDRSPIWIKLHCAILDDYDFAHLADETKFHAIGLMLLASRLNNKFPEDEAWLRQKINANSEINLKNLLEIGFLSVIREEKTDAKNTTNARKLNKLQGKSASATLNIALHKENFSASVEQNRTEEKRTEHNTTQQTRNAIASDAENRVCVSLENPFQERTLSEIAKTSDEKEKVIKGSRFSLDEILRYVSLCQANGNTILNPHGLASHLKKTGEADSAIHALLYPEQFQIETFGSPRKFSDAPCSKCFGAKLANVDGKGFRKCQHCVNERGASTGFEPMENENE